MVFSVVQHKRILNFALDGEILDWQQSMQTVTLTLHKIFDVVESAHKRKPVTLLGFESNGKRQYGVPVPGRPDVKNGDSITALLAKPDDWQTIIGWINHRTGQIVLDDGNYERFNIVIGTGLLIMFSVTLYGKPLMLIPIGTMMLISIVWCVNSLRKIKIAKKRLVYLKKSIVELSADKTTGI